MSPVPAANRIDHTFARLRAAGEKGFIAYITAGDPGLPQTVTLALALEAAGVDILEMGVPFSDPLADGTVNQAAASRALASGTTVAGVLGAVRELRSRGLAIPIVLYTYLNPIYVFGFGRFLAEAVAVGVDGLLILDLPPDETERNEDLRRRPAALKMIRLIAPTTPPERIAQIAARAEGFIYFVSREGVTGEQQSVSASLGQQVAAIRAATTLPVAVGFGISTPAHAREAARSADAVVVGSAIVRQIAEHGAQPDLDARVAAFVEPMVEAVKKRVLDRPSGREHFSSVHKLPFTKMNGAGNDFVMFDNRAGDLRLDTAAIARLCDRHRGVGADGVLLVEQSDDPATAAYRMRYFNADGGEAEMCGNGARCFARFAAHLEASREGESREREHLSFQTVAGVIRAHLDGELVRLEMSRPTEGADLGVLTFDDGKLPRSFFLNTGVPHVVVPVSDAERVDVHLTGRAIRYHARFAPKGTNANFVETRSPTEIILRTYERGVESETLACGTGATASALIHAELNNVVGKGSVAVQVRSGDVLHIGFERTGPFQFEHVTLGGPADFVFNGEIPV